MRICPDIFSFAPRAYVVVRQGEPVTLPDGTATMLPTLPVEMDGGRANAAAALPTPGADGAAVLHTLGYGEEEIARLIA